ncbi:MAG: hypothetical protein ACFCUE_15430 [Candidatus Bathyarchaeia archaeon]|jgi:Arc/MetJ-type ribon-helix-helix transcriptional regulator
MPKKTADPYHAAMQQLIKDGLYQNQQEIIKDALRRLFQHYNIQLLNKEPEKLPVTA